MDNKLNIYTEELQSDGRDTFYNHRYEPTSYEVLMILFDNISIASSDVFVDYGCGLGRVNFLVNSLYNCRTVGIEYNKQYFIRLIKNLDSYIEKKKGSRGDITFINSTAQDYIVRREDNIFYFFNPFSIHIFMRVVNNIMMSYEECNRDMRIILYYPDEEYIYYLDNNSIFVRQDMIKIGEGRECFLVYGINNAE